MSWMPSRCRSRRLGDVYVCAFLFLPFSFHGKVKLGGLARWLRPPGRDSVFYVLHRPFSPRSAFELNQIKPSSSKRRALGLLHNLTNPKHNITAALNVHSCFRDVALSSPVIQNAVSHSGNRSKYRTIAVVRNTTTFAFPSRVPNHQKIPKPCISTRRSPAPFPP
jgi:hypothetical protein